MEGASAKPAGNREKLAARPSVAETQKPTELEIPCISENMAAIRNEPKMN
jgi:hypothetical protein